MNNAIGNLHANSQAWEVGQYSIDCKRPRQPPRDIPFFICTLPLRIFAKGGSDSYFKIADKI